MVTPSLFFLPVPQEFLPEGSQSHLGRLLPKLQEVNRCLGDLLSTASKVRAADKQHVVVCVSSGPILPPPYAGGWADIRAARVPPGSEEVTWLCGQDRGWGTAKRTAQLVPSCAGGCSRHLGD